MVPTVNRDEGGYRLTHVWDSLLVMPSSEPMVAETLM